MQPRRLAAIMFTDIVGYSALTQRDEALAMELLDLHREMLRPVFIRFEGREIKTIGDAFLIEFPSDLQAVKCGIAMQQCLRDYNDDADPGHHVNIRLGIHVGDVIVRDGDCLLYTSPSPRDA